ncbi:hypothetical protein ABFY09_07055 [Marinomonas sp. 5E14-1]|uniref:hypothetical protein n=1 Tax=Marinomonas sp. 5E14-1 TaxID=3153922 RepID=UPI0032640578
MKLDIESLDSSLEIRTTVIKNKESLLEMYIFFPKDMSIHERDIQANTLLESKASRYHYSISKSKFPLLKLKSKKPERKSDFPIFLKAFKLQLSNLIRDVKSNHIKYIETAKSLLLELRSTPTTETNIKDFKIADELCSYYAEQMSLVYYDKSLKKRNSAMNLDDLVKFASEERTYRKLKYGLKSKEAQHIRRKEDHFYKSINISQQNRKLGVVREQIAFSISAFLSMLLTTLIVFYFQRGYGTVSFAVFIALCVSYIFKDRFKEIFRNYIVKKMNKGKYNLKSILTDSDNNIIGNCYELSEFKIPNDDILKIRGKGKFTKKEENEVVIYYKKKYDLNDNFINDFSQLRDTMNININHLLELLPDITLRYMSLDKNGLMKRKFSMLHDLNIVVRLNEKKVERYRVKLSHSSIEKLERVKLS